MPRTLRTIRTLTLAGAALLLGIAGPAEAQPTTTKTEKKPTPKAKVSFKSRSDDEKAFVERVGAAVVKAAHFSAQKPVLVKYEYITPRPGRTELNIKMNYQGAVSGKVTGKKYVADIVVKIDSADKLAWEVLNIEYNDNNNVSPSYRKLQDLIKEMNR